MGSPTLSPRGSVGLSGTNSLPRQDRRCSSGSPDSAEMAGLAVGHAGDVPNQMPSPKKRFGELRELVGRKVEILKENVEEKWEKAKDNVGSKVTQAKAYFSKLKNPEPSPARTDNAHQNTGIFVVPSRGEGSSGTSPGNVEPSGEIETEVGEDALRLTLGSGATEAHVSQTSVTDFRGNILREKGSTGVESSAAGINAYISNVCHCTKFTVKYGVNFRGRYGVNFTAIW